jgi:hypothetical protein
VGVFAVGHGITSVKNGFVCQEMGHVGACGSHSLRGPMAGIDPYKPRCLFIVPKIRRKSNYFFTK